MKADGGLDVDGINARLGLLARHADKKKLPFANVTPRQWFRLHPPLDEADVQRFESEHGVVLPEEYRQFLLHVGNGGGGGIFPLGCDSEGTSHEQALEAWRDGSYRQYLYGGLVLNQPFPHTRAWQPDSSKEERDTAVDERSDPQVAGSMRIYHCGCAIYNILVLTGKERGHVWRDARADGGGIIPEQPADGIGRLTFGRWYLDLLDQLFERHGINFDA
jgi:hypothetical protein